jgi:hypothetical protein
MVLPNPATACLGVHRLTRSHPSGPLLAGPSHTCSRENSREGEPSVLPSAVLKSPGRASPCQATPIPATPRRVGTCQTSSTLQREQQWEPKPPVLPSAAVARPDRDLTYPARTRPAVPIPTPPNLI